MSLLTPLQSRTARILRGLTFLIAASVPLAAQAATDLMSVYAKALDANPDYQSAVSAFHVAVEARPQALSKLLPQVAALGNAAEAEQAISGRYFLDTTAVAPEGFDSNKRDQFYSVGYALGLTQAVFHWDLFVSLDEADLKVGSAGLQIYDAQDALRVGVAEAYFGVLAADDLVRFTAAERDAINQLLDQVKNRYASGLLTDLDVKQAQSQADLAAAALIGAENAVQVSRVELEQITGGQRYDVLKTLSPQYQPEPPSPDRLNDWIERARVQNLKLQAQRYSTQVAQKEVARAQSLRYPTLDAYAGRQYSYANGGISRGIGAGNNHEWDDRVQLNMKLPIYSGGAVSSAIRAAQAGFDKARYDEASVLNQAVKDTQVAFLNSSAEMAQIAAFRQAVQSAQEAEASARTGYDVGTKTLSDVLQAVRGRYKAERDYAQARYTYLVNYLKLKRAAGALNNADLLAVNKWLQ
ncbi:MAG: hypothetical protein JWR16_2625 [Nevskia sp.]|nr:hypothetical protein [Nevskia sp.]